MSRFLPWLNPGVSTGLNHDKKENTCADDPVLCRGQGAASLCGYEPKRHDGLTDAEDMDLWVCHASGAANTKIVKGKLEYGKKYLISRGEELGWGLKPAAVLEYSSHWPWDYCYLYKL